MKKLLVVLLATLALTLGAVAQENPAKLALAREVISAMKADKMFDAMGGQMKQMAAQMAPVATGATPEQIKQTEELRNRIMDLALASAKGMMARMDHIYAEIYDEEELQAMKAFFTSSAGQSMLNKQPQISARLMPMMQEMQRDLLAQIKQAIEAAKPQAPAPAPAAP